MADLKFRVEMGETRYRIVSVDDQYEGALADYGDAAILVIGAAIYYCLVTEPDTDTPVVYRVDSVSAMPTEVEDVIFDNDEDEEEGEVIEVTPARVEEDDEEEEDEEQDEQHAPTVR